MMTPVIHPLLMSAPMVLAILREIANPGTGKTVTRRLPKDQPPDGHELVGIYAPRLTAVFNPAGKEHRGDSDQDVAIPLKYMPGDLIYVREHWRTVDVYQDLPPRDMSGEEPIRYEADETWETWGWKKDGNLGRHRQAMHMPRWASRITLKVTDVKVERLQDISETEAIAEGCKGWVSQDGDNGESPIEEFQDLWDSLNGTPRKPGGPDISWKANPWVVAISFTPILANVDNLPEPPQ